MFTIHSYYFYLFLLLKQTEPNRKTRFICNICQLLEESWTVRGRAIIARFQRASSKNWERQWDVTSRKDVLARALLTLMTFKSKVTATGSKGHHCILKDKREKGKHDYTAIGKPMRNIQNNIIWQTNKNDKLTEIANGYFLIIVTILYLFFSYVLSNTVSTY